MVSSSPSDTFRFLARVSPSTISGALESLRNRPSRTSPGMDDTRGSVSGCTPRTETPNDLRSLDIRTGAAALAETRASGWASPTAAASASMSGTANRIFGVSRYLFMLDLCIAAERLDRVEDHHVVDAELKAGHEDQQGIAEGHRARRQPAPPFVPP